MAAAHPQLVVSPTRPSAPRGQHRDRPHSFRVAFENAHDRAAVGDVQHPHGPVAVPNGDVARCRVAPAGVWRRCGFVMGGPDLHDVVGRGRRGAVTAVRGGIAADAASS